MEESSAGLERQVAHPMSGAAVVPIEVLLPMDWGEVAAGSFSFLDPIFLEFTQKLLALFVCLAYTCQSA